MRMLFRQFIERANKGGNHLNAKWVASMKTILFLSFDVDYKLKLSLFWEGSKSNFQMHFKFLQSSSEPFFLANVVIIGIRNIIGLTKSQR